VGKEYIDYSSVLHTLIKVVNMKKLLLVLIMLLMGCTIIPNNVRFDNEYDYDLSMVTSHDLESIRESVIPFITVTTFKNGEDIEKYELMGNGTVLPGNYILTVSHVAYVPNYTVFTPFGPMAMDHYKRMSAETYLILNGKKVPLRIVYNDPNVDVALLKAPDNVELPTFKHELGDSDDLKIGNYVYLFGNPLNQGRNVREGTVTSLMAPQQISQVDAIAENTFMISNGLIPGDSGTPVIALRDGRYEIVGLAQGVFTTNNKLGWVIRINVVKELLKEYLDG
jgi:S1-C subfamily serine protease